MVSSTWRLMRRTVVAAAVVCVFTASLAAAHCPNNCAGHGECDTGSEIRCRCWNGWGGGDCSLRLCPTGTSWADDATGIDTAHASHAECSDRGVCDYNTGKCKCEEGFEGLACQRMSCREDCKYRGRCVSMRRHALNFQNAVNQTTYALPWDADMVHGCECDPAYEGHDCSLRKCPRGDDPLTHNQLDEVQEVTCRADAGFFVLYLENLPSKRVAFDASRGDIEAALEPVTDVVRVTFMNSETTACENDADGSTFQITFTRRFGDVPDLAYKADWQNTLSSSHASGVGLAVSEVQAGEKEWEYCSGRGRCNQETGLCECYTGYYSSNGEHAEGTRGDCGAALDPITACPGTPLECSGHGVCNDFPQYRCTCNAGWTGGDCSERVCPFGPAWFDLPSADNDAHDEAECSNKGICDRRSGKCVCETGFHGEACERMKCPQVGEEDECSGHGRCMAMEQLAENADLNGDIPTPIYTYGRERHNPFTWDRVSVHGCKCDPGWHGYDCSLKTCPTGDDPHTPGLKEVQTITCSAAGEFVVSFRTAVAALNGLTGTTAAIPDTATAADLKAALEALDTMGEVTVDFTDATPTTLCNPGNVARITFDGDLGDVPEMQLVSDSTNSASIDTAREGATEDDTCSNRGICNEATGVCNCFTQWGSSNGANGPGLRADCGYVLPFIPVDTAAADRRAWRTRNYNLLLQDSLPAPGQDDDQFVH